MDPRGSDGPGVDDVVGALQERLLCMGVGPDDLIVADPFMKRAPWRKRVGTAMLTNVPKMFIIRGGRHSPVTQAEMNEFRTIRARGPGLRDARTRLGLLWPRVHGLVSTLPCFPV